MFCRSEHFFLKNFLREEIFSLARVSFRPIFWPVSDSVSDGKLALLLTALSNPYVIFLKIIFNLLVSYGFGDSCLTEIFFMRLFDLEPREFLSWNLLIDPFVCVKPFPALIFWNTIPPSVLSSLPFFLECQFTRLFHVVTNAHFSSTSHPQLITQLLPVY